MHLETSAKLAILFPPQSANSNVAKNLSSQ